MTRRAALSLVGAGVLVVVWFLTGRTTFPEVPPQVDISDARGLATMSAAQRSEWLSKLEATTGGNGRSVQALLVSEVPEKPPLVVATAADEGTGDEHTTHWPIPWPQAVATVQQQPASPVTVFGRHSGVTYRHQIVPVSQEDGLYLLVVEARPSPGLLNWRLVFPIAAVWLAVWGTLSGRD